MMALRCSAAFRVTFGRFRYRGVHDTMKKFLLALLALMMLPHMARADLTLHFIDVGQGDSVLVQCGGASMLVDAGPAEAGAVVNAYIRNTGLSELDYVVATHEHDDHLFGMPDALSGLRVGTVYSSPAVPMTYWFESILPRLRQESLVLLRPQSLESFALGDATVTFLNTLTASENPNDLSLVLRIDYGETSALLTADIEGEAEMNLVNSTAPLKADVLKVAHHGGNTSTCEAFVKAVDPRYAVISVGKGNRHGHPHSGPLSNLEKRDVIVYRTDLFGTVTGTSDGKNWTFGVSKAR